MATPMSPRYAKLPLTDGGGQFLLQPVRGHPDFDRAGRAARWYRPLPV